jgi:hypothetical protein
MRKVARGSFAARGSIGAVILALALLASPVAQGATAPSDSSGADQYTDPFYSATGPVTPGEGAPQPGAASNGDRGVPPGAPGTVAGRRLTGPDAIVLQRISGDPGRPAAPPARGTPGFTRAAARQDSPSTAAAVADAAAQGGGPGLLLLLLVLVMAVLAIVAGAHARRQGG